VSSYAAIPRELRERAQWIVWRSEVRAGRRTKIPCRSSDPTRKASVTDPDSWGSFEQAVTAAGQAEGAGFVFTDADDLLGVDLDGCYRADGRLHAAAAAVLLALPSYAERSPGGRGAHVILRGHLTSQRHRTSETPWGGGLEVYASRRFFTVTGDRVPGTPESVEDCQAELDELLAELLPPPIPNGDAPPPPSVTLELDDEELLGRARAAVNGRDFDALYGGCWDAYASQSEADLALTNMIAFWAGPDPERIDRLFRGSRLWRTKWGSPRGDSTYGEQTIARALEGRTEDDFYHPRREAPSRNERAPVSEAGKDTNDWPAVASHVLPAFPTSALPRSVQSWVAAVSEEAQTPEDLAAMAALGVLSAAGMGAATVDCGAWTEELALYLLTAMASGDRKSTVQRAAAKPLRVLERERREDALPEIRENRSRRDVLDQRVKALTKKVANVADPEEEAELAAALEELVGIGEPVVPRLLADDTTAEALGGLLAQHGTIAVIASESALIDNLVAGRYSEGAANLHLLCAAYAGEPFTIDRRGRDPEEIERPLVTVALAVQPHVLRALVDHPIARSQGLVARFAYALPETHLGRRKINAPSAPLRVQEEWATTVRRVFQTPKSADTTDTTLPGGGSVGSVSTLEPARIALTPGAKALLDGLREAMEPRLGAGGDLRPVADWVARHPGRVARTAGLLHLAQAPVAEPISEATMSDALRIGDYLLAHGLAALTGPDPLVRRALDWLAGRQVVTERDLQRGPLYGRRTADEARALAQSLEGLGALRPLPAAPAGARGGRPLSPSYEVHPDLAGADRTDTTERA
jgi:hypothetical protein